MNLDILSKNISKSTAVYYKSLIKRAGKWLLNIAEPEAKSIIKVPIGKVIKKIKTIPVVGTRREKIKKFQMSVKPRIE